jgi:hypothetical protein
VTASPRPLRATGGANYGDIRAGRRYMAGRSAVEGMGRAATEKARLRAGLVSESQDVAVTGVALFRNWLGAGRQAAEGAKNISQRKKLAVWNANRQQGYFARIALRASTISAQVSKGSCGKPQ